MAEGKMIAFCGVLCSECPAFKATLAGDEELLRKTAEEWSTDDYEMTPETTECDGCTTVGGKLARCSAECDVRKCGLEREVVNCASCDDFACETLERAWGGPGGIDAKTTLEEIRRMLKGS